MKKTIKRIVSLLCMLCLLASVWLPLLPDAPAERATAAPASVSREVTVTDGSRYIVTVGYDTAFLAAEDVELRVAELTEADEGYSDYLTRSAEALGAEEESIQFARALDISLYDLATGEELQPTGSVSVSITLPDTALEESGNVGVVHFGEEPEVLEAEVSENAVTFETEGFSVYLVIAHEGDDTGNPVETPRVEFHYLSPDFTYSSADQNYTAGLFSFPNNGGDFQTSQILRNDEVMEMIANPPNRENDNGTKKEYFFGWYLVDCQSVADDGQVTYTWTADPLKVVAEQKLTLSKTEGVTVGEELTWTLGSVSDSGTVDGEGLIHVYLAPIYQDYYFINFHMGALGTSLAGSIRNRLLVVLGNDNEAEVRIGNITATSSDSKHQIFSGWETSAQNEYYQTVNVEGKELSSAPDAAPGTLGEYRIRVDTDSFDGNALDLYPVYVEARWLNFYLGADHNGALYVGSKYLLTHDGGADVGTYFTTLPTTSRAGYTFKGWYADAVVDSETGEILNLTTPMEVTMKDKEGNEHTESRTAKLLYDPPVSGSSDSTPAVQNYKREFNSDDTGHDDVLYEIQDGKLWFYKALDDLTLSALWQPETVDYTVVYWLQNTKGDGYSLLSYETKQGLAGNDTAAQQITADSTLINDDDGEKLRTVLNYCKLSPDQDPGESGEQSGIQQEKIAGDGSTIVNVYYDRKKYTLRFDIGYSYSESNAVTTAYAVLTPEAAASYGGTVYGEVDGEPLALTSDGSGGWTYSGTVTTRHDYDGYRYQATTGAAEPQYGVVGGEVVALSGGISYTRTNRAYYSVSNNTNNNNYYINVGGTLTQTYLYRNNNRWWRTQTDNGWQANPRYTYSNEYTGTVYSTNNDNNNVVGTAYTGAVYYLNERSEFDPSGTGTPYGSNTNGRYFQLTPNPNFTYNGGTAYPAASPRYLRVATDDADTAYTLGFIDGSMQTVQHDDDGWYYNTNDPAVVSYTGTLYYVKTITSTRFCVSSINNTDNYNDFLADSGTNRNAGRAFYPWEYTDTKTEGKYTVYYYDLTARFGEEIADRWPGEQSDKGSYNFIGWIAQKDSYFWCSQPGTNNARSSLKGGYTVMDEGIILTHYPNNVTQTNPTNAITDKSLYRADDVGENGEGIAQEFRCRYSANARRYVYEIYKYDQDTGQFKMDPPLKVYSGTTSNASSGTPAQQAILAYTGYTTPEKDSDNMLAVTDTSGNTRRASQINSVQTGDVYDLEDMGYPGLGTGMIIRYYYYPHKHTISFQYGSRAEHPNTSVDPDHTGYDFYYDQSLAGAKTLADSFAAEGGIIEQNIPEGCYFAGWFSTPNGADGTEVDFTGTMPDSDLIFYAVYKPNRFRVILDPNGGQLDRYDHNGGYTYDFHPGEGAMGYYGATFFKTDYLEHIDYYEMDGWRQYVEITASEAAEMREAGDPVYVYMNTQYTKKYDGDGYDLEAPLRSALYLREDELETYHNFYFQNSKLSTSPLGFPAWKDEYLKKDETGALQYYRPLRTGEHYTFLGWFQVNADGSVSNVPYDNTTPCTADTTLRALWRLDNSIVVNYIPDSYVDTAHINAELRSWMDPDITMQQNYVDGAETVITQQPTGITADDDEEEGKNYIFRGWRVVSVREAGGITTYKPLQDNVYYDPGDDFVIYSRYAQEVEVDEGRKQLTIFLQAVYERKVEAYRRAGVTDLILHPNEQGTVSGDLPEEASTGAVALEGNRIRFDGSQSNDAVFLSKYTTPLDVYVGTYGNFSHEKKYYLLGFDDGQNEKDFIATYPSDSLISNWRRDATHTEENRTIYAVWEPMVYLTVENRTGVGPVSFTLDSEDALALYVINEVTGAFDRVDIRSQVVTVDDGKSKTIVLPYGKESHVSILGTNDLGPGQILYWDSRVTVDGTEFNTKNGVFSYRHTVEGMDDHDHALSRNGPKDEFKDVENTENFTIPVEMIENPEAVTVTFTAVKHDYTLKLHDNYREDGPELYFEETDEVMQLDGDALLESPTSRYPYTFLGYDFDRLDDNSEATLDYAFSSDFKIEHIRSFFDTYDTDGDGIVTLYAAWKYRLEAYTTLVRKTVSELGDRNKEFKFVLTLSGEYQRLENNNSNSKVTIDSTNNVSGNAMSAEFKLKDGEYLKIFAQKDVGEPGVDSRPWIQAQVTRCNAEDEPIEVPSTIRWESNTDIMGTVAFDTLAYFTLSEVDYTLDLYDTETARVAEQIENSYTIVDSRTIQWNKADYSGAFEVTNTRQTARVTVQKAIGNTESLPELDPFRFSASYTLPGSSESVKLSSFAVSGGESHLLEEKIPVGADLVIREVLDEGDDRFITSAADNAATHGSLDTNDLSYTLEVPNSNTKVTYTNTLRSFPVRIVLVDQDGAIGPQGRFDLIADYEVLRSSYWTKPDNNLIYSGLFYAGYSYSLEETDVEDGYLSILEKAVFQVTGVGVSDPGVKGVAVEPDGTGGYVITVMNRQTVDITVKAGLKDPMDDRRTFYYTYSYQMPGEGLTERSFSITAYSTENGAVSAAEDPVELTIPVGAQNLVIQEDTSRPTTTTTPPDTVGTTYDILVQYNSTPAASGAVYSYGTTDIAAGHKGDVITFYNNKKTIQVILQKVVELEEKDGSFSFTVSLLKGSTPINNYAIFGDSDPVRTDTSGQVSFSLQDVVTVPASIKTMTVPVGAKLEIAETGAVDGVGNAIPEESYTASVTAVKTASPTDTLSVGTGKTFTFTAGSENTTVTFTNASSGMDIQFLKTDGFGNPLGGATFALYTDPACTAAFRKNGVDPVTAKSASGPDNKGMVLFEKIPNNVYYMKETPSYPTDSDEVVWKTSNTYLLLVGDTALGTPGAYGLDQADIIAQTGGTEKYAFFRVDVSGSGGSLTVQADPALDIATFGILNEAQSTRRVILRKTDKKSSGKHQMLQGARFRIFRPDLSEVTLGQEEGKTYYESLSSGVWFTGALPYGKYYLVETVAPGTPTGYSGNAGKVYVLVVTKDGFFDGNNTPVKQLDLPAKVNGSTEDAIVNAFKEWRRNQVAAP